ncbi:MAG: GTP 3',8-cyclase MoaA [Terrimicrobiaceae bacterium]|nr:GTP 3',8-cyclase MoaA [Terrimicrobiaceae bacterium]
MIRLIVIRDSFGRSVDYLRISVTDRCDERCLYCRPAGYSGWAPRSEHLTAEEIGRVVEAAVRLGFRTFRITGGEPLLRADVVEICRTVAGIRGVESLALSTNGTRLAGSAKALRQAGVASVNISLDALDTGLYRRMTGGDLTAVREGIDVARECFSSVKLNCVLIRGVNESEYVPLVHQAAEWQIPVRFIELMPLSRTVGVTPENFLPVGEVERRLGGLGKWSEASVVGRGPARYRRLDPPGAVVGFIGALTTPGFCESCNKVRLTADGKLRPCLGRHGEVDLRDALRSGGDPEALLRASIDNKPEAHEFLAAYEPLRPMTAIGG